jgi:MFS family permease
MSTRLRIAVVVTLLMIGTFANNALSTIYVVYEKRFDFSSLSVTAIFATYAVAVLVALLVVGRLSDDIGRKPLMVAGALMLILSSVIFLLATGTAMLFVGRAIVGLATGTVMPAATAALVELEPNHDRRRASLLSTVGFLSGAALGPLIFGVMAQYLPRPTVTPFYVEIAVQVLGLVGVLALKEPATHVLKPMTWRVQRPSVPKEIRARFALAGVVVTIGWIVGGIYGSLGGSLDVQLLHVRSHALAGLLLFTFAFIGGASQFVFRSRSSRQAMFIGVTSTLVGIICVEASLFAVSAPLFLVATVLVGVGNGMCFIGSLVLVNEISPLERRAETVAAYNVVAYFALSLPVVGVGVLANMFGLKSATVTFAVVLVALAAATLVTLGRTPTRPTAIVLEPEPSTS